jgi:hypothetical protein
MEVAIGGVVAEARIEGKRVQAIGDAVADAVDSAAACKQATQAGAAATAGVVTEPSAGRNDRPAARRDARRGAFFGRGNGFNRNKSETNNDGETQNCRRWRAHA